MLNSYWIFYQRCVPLGACEQSWKGKDLCWGNYWELPGANRLEGTFLVPTTRFLVPTTRLQGGKVIYFGDHLAADLADVTLHHGWKTAAVIRSGLPMSLWLNPSNWHWSKYRELETEIGTMNQDEFKWGVNWQQVKCWDDKLMHTISLSLCLRYLWPWLRIIKQLRS